MAVNLTEAQKAAIMSGMVEINKGLEEGNEAKSLQYALGLKTHKTRKPLTEAQKAERVAKKAAALGYKLVKA